jgi:hypothetical protein
MRRDSDSHSVGWTGNGIVHTVLSVRIAGVAKSDRLPWTGPPAEWRHAGISGVWTVSCNTSAWAALICSA